MNVTYILTSVVFAAFVTSVANTIISLISNNRIKTIEKQKRNDEIKTYRYTKLYEMSLQWTNMNTPYDTKNKSISEIANNRIINNFIDDSRKLTIISPLLDDDLKTKIIELQNDGETILLKLIDIENQLDDEKNNKKIAQLNQDHHKYYREFKKASVKFCTELELVLEQQLNRLLKQ